MEKITEEVWEKLFARAREAMEKAYAPYSRFQVGAALLARDGRIFAGCNVENASYSLTICAERVAVATAVAAGCREFVALALVSSADDYIYPCGACRQVLFEFAPAMLVGVSGLQGIKIVKVAELLPAPFDGGVLETNSHE